MILAISRRSSSMTTSSTQCSPFSIPQLLRTMALKRSGRDGAAEQIAARFDRGFAVDLAAGGDLADGLEAWPAVALLQPGDISRQRSRAGLDAAVALVGVGCARERRRRIVEEAAHVIVQRLLVALERQHVIGALIDNLLGDLALAAHRVGRDDAALER